MSQNDIGRVIPVYVTSAYIAEAKVEVLWEGPSDTQKEQRVALAELEQDT